MTHDEIMLRVKKIGAGRIYDYISIAIANNVGRDVIVDNLDKMYLEYKGKSKRIRINKLIDKYLESDGDYSTNEMLPKETNRGNKGLSVQYKGIIYPTIKEAAKAHGIHPETMRRKIKNGEAVIL